MSSRLRSPAKITCTSCLSFVPSSALRKGLHTTSMRPLPRLEYETKSGAICTGYFCQAPKLPTWERPSPRTQPPEYTDPHSVIPLPVHSDPHIPDITAMLRSFDLISARPRHLLILVLLYPLFIGAGRADVSQEPDAAAIAANNRAVALMGRFDYWKAEQAFAALAEQYPDWLDLRVNRAIAILNRQQDGDDTAALELVESVLSQAPAHARAHYVAGLLRLYLGSPEAAEAHFRKVSEADPRDAYAVYYLGQCMAQQSRFKPAIAAYRKAIELDPYLRSAYYGAFQSAQRLRDRQTARNYLDDYQRLARNPRARLAEFRYTRMGAKGEVLAMDAAEAEPAAASSGPLFGPVQVLSAQGPRPVLPTAVTPVDILGDAKLELFVSAGGQSSRLYSFDAAPGLAAVQGHPLTAVKGVNAALWGDYDNDGLTDVYLCRDGPNRLYRQAARGHWQDVSKATGTTGGGVDTRDGVFLDADHDGDLDLFLVNANAPNELLNNNLDGSFRPLAQQQGIGGDGRPSRAVLPLDLDGDRDVDLIVLNQTPPHEIYLNDRLWAYSAFDGLKSFRETPSLAVLAADLDADGRDELLSFTPDGRLLRWRPGKDQSMVPDELVTTGADNPSWAQLAVLDVDGNGRLDLLAAWPGGWRVYRADGKSLSRYDAPAEAPLAGVTPMLLQADRGPALAALFKDGALRMWSAGPGRHAAVSFSLSGKTDTAETMRSNASGIGARLALRRGSVWPLPPAFRVHSGPGQGLQAHSVGLGGAANADFLSIEWSDGVFQTELDLHTGGPHAITETQRQLSSCPVLFAWNGSEYAFVSDFLGVGGMGYAIGPGEYAPPRPWENLLLPAKLLQVKQGRYVLKLTEPMEEAAYLDAARLMAWDLPPGWHMVLDERMGIAGPEPTGEPRFYRHEVLPTAAVNDRGQDVMPALGEVDGDAAPPGPLDRRFIGRLAREHVIELHFNESLHSHAGSPMLVADGWVEYPYSQTMFAAWQAGAGFDAPTLEARDKDGRWHVLLGQFGYPAGMPRRMSVPLPELPPGSDALRLRSNMEIYWDRLAVAYAEPLPRARRTELPMAKVRMGRSGFPSWTYAAQRRPLLDYQRRSPFRDTRHMAGLYTRFGPAGELVGKIDDAVAVIGPGEELHLEFSADEPDLPAGWSRLHVLETNGWAKDMDLFTKDGETIGPMPGSGHPVHARDALHARYNTRYREGG